ncbi:putative polypeptide N-acetylgalactosaminyltransferase 10 [Schistosoma japonicum]|uniref:Polypeptide N-acetylgalactosaminyltransferase n=1 Tax=Schistosoma japonicum TaxID=6182 RepID=A0A4Z2CZ59_SCHJA|nr:polypeptide N-acetylgalactosaminyltransferase 10 [Schistosoma japonicum]TNN09408.1 putative polypeptide N-acetylgalactosaminyltransferase 10 [Schistosoma japonicum]
MRFVISRRIGVIAITVSMFLCFPIIYNMYININQLYLTTYNNCSEFNCVDWENYSFSVHERMRRGPGENGLPVRLSTSQKVMSKKTLNLNGFNTYVSEKVKVDRSIKDIRHPKCRGALYSEELPSVSIIIPVYEEHWETLIRTIVSILNRSPLKLIKEVILVDDGSSRKHLKERLDKYLSKTYPDSHVWVIHLREREGLIRARLAGAELAAADVLVFLDSHCEANVNWLPPLLDPISKNYRTVTCPFIDVIDADTLEYHAQDDGARGAFDWYFYYKRLPRLLKDRLNPEKPFDSPVMAGGLFAISKKWFWELGGYDPELRIWGGEQYELSFKIWMCGGRLIDVPCSRVGHIYRKYSVNFPQPKVKNFLRRNFKRVAEVWMDEYKEYIYRSLPECRMLNPGDLSKQHNLRKQLQCKSFHWFMTEIAFDLMEMYPPPKKVSFAVGEIRSVAFPYLCLDGTKVNSRSLAKLHFCCETNKGNNCTQNFEYFLEEDIRIFKKSLCLEVPDAKHNGPVLLYSCHGQRGNQHWQLRPVHSNKENPVNIIHFSTLCLDINLKNLLLFVRRCDSNSRTQRWNWKNLRFDTKTKSVVRDILH